MTSLEATLIVEEITYQQLDEFIQRCVDDGFNAHYFGPCLIIEFDYDGRISFMPAGEGKDGKGGADFNFTATYLSPHTEGLMGCLKVVEQE